MNAKEASAALEWVLRRKVIAIVRGQEPEHMVKLACALYEGGVDLIEVTFNQARPETWKDTTAAIEAVCRELADKVLPGAGTVMTEEQLLLAEGAGAKYIITPNTDVALIRRVKELGLLSFPGAMTPSEIAAAYHAGADAVKVFPAGVLGPDYVKALRAPLSQIPLLAVGGVDECNAAEFLAAGCVGVGVGRNLVRKDLIAAGEWDRLTEIARAYRSAVAGLN